VDRPSNRTASAKRSQCKRRRSTCEANAPRHYGKAFEASCKLLEAEAKLSGDATSSGTRRRLNKTVREETAKLESLTARDRDMTRLLAQYLRQHGGEMQSYMQSYMHFIEWCNDQGKLTDLDERTIQYRLQNQYCARGKRGRPQKACKNRALG
jgi:hypothetical protein